MIFNIRNLLNINILYIIQYKSNNCTFFVKMMKKLQFQSIFLIEKA